MSSPLNQKHSETARANTPELAVPTDLLLSLAVGPILLGIITLEAVSSWLEVAGTSSEEVFRGDRLPILHFPNAARED
jgi:hypothetical protein